MIKETQAWKETGLEREMESIWLGTCCMGMCCERRPNLGISMKMEKVAGRSYAGFRPHDRTKTPGLWGLKVDVKLGGIKDHRVFLLCRGNQ
jgi:hypothetical protein